MHLRTDDSGDIREGPRKVRRKICKERRSKTGITQISLRLKIIGMGQGPRWRRITGQ